LFSDTPNPKVDLQYDTLISNYELLGRALEGHKLRMNTITFCRIEARMPGGSMAAEAALYLRMSYGKEV
jgi:hypothetical protein